ncbi:nuclear transport factor 2 family protein [Agrococcus sp. Marseille-P2731]|uniref:nuclear transport factor 2 family protein n=1 Tax=Agrococcus sp. Marseille-P2731 TaxID=1841862 RepID=UPI0009307010|nr:nuclear transport factor 2 family protein [Agrococcus sp. Marseille-P2731]
MSTALQPFDRDQLPSAILRYLDAVDPASRSALPDTGFAGDARVRDEGIEHLGRDAIRTWLLTAASEYTYTTTYTAQVADGPQRWTVHAHLQGDFPGGEADLRFHFRLEGERIAELVIEP